MKQWHCGVFIVLVIGMIIGIKAAEWPEVFAGPRSNWIDVKRDHGATGNGTTDDTRALQAALTALQSNRASATLYIPAGTYLITSMLSIGHIRDFAIIGEDPATTVIKWGGANNGDMFGPMSDAYCRYKRLTFDGASTANRGFMIQWDYASYFPTSIEISDMLFKNLKIGIQGGSYPGPGQQSTAAEVSVIRCSFNGCTKAGIYIEDWNTVDWWIRHSLFQNNQCGIHDSIGVLSVYNNVFKQNQIDCKMNAAEFYALRNNYSIGSKRFLDDGWIDGGLFATIQGNTVLDPTDPQPIFLRHGRYLIVDNIIRSPANATTPPISIGCRNAGAKHLSVGNTFTVTPAYTTDANSQVRAIGDLTVARTSINPTEPVLPSTPSRYTGTIIEPTAMTGAAIQSAISDAITRFNGQKPVVYLKGGQYSVPSTINIPKNSDVRIVSDDGTKPTLTWGGANLSFIMNIAGPSKAQVTGVKFAGAGKGGGIQISEVDQTNSRIFIYRPFIIPFETRGIGIYASGLDYTYIECWDNQIGSLDNSTVIVSGGPATARGDATSSRVTLIGGTYGPWGGSKQSWDVKNNGRLMIMDWWYENGALRLPMCNLANASSGSLTFSGGKIQYYGVRTGGPTHIANGFKGNLTIVGSHIIDGIVSLGGSEPLQNAFCFGNWFGPDNLTPSTGDPGTTYTQTATQGNHVFMNNYYHTVLTPAPEDVGNPTDDWILKMLAQIRSERIGWNLDELPTGITDVRLWNLEMTAMMGPANILVSGGGTNVQNDLRGFSRSGSFGIAAQKVMCGSRIELPENGSKIKIYDFRGKIIGEYATLSLQERSAALRALNTRYGKNIMIVKMEK